MAVLECSKREKMAQMVAAGDSQADAYRAAFNSTGAPNTVHVNASKIMAETKVKLRVTEIKEELAEKALWTRMDSVMVLSEIARGIDEEARPSDRVNAVKAINQMHGWDKTTVDHTSSDGSMTPKPTRIELVAPNVDSTDTDPA